jgi:hypothetical protein
MTEANWLILTWDFMLWITEDQKTKIKFHRNIGPDDGILRYTINGNLKEISSDGGLSSDDRSFKFFNSSGTWQVKMNDDNTINVVLPEINNLKFHQINDPIKPIK